MSFFAPVLKRLTPGNRVCVIHNQIVGEATTKAWTDGPDPVVFVGDHHRSSSSSSRSLLREIPEALPRTRGIIIPCRNQDAPMIMRTQVVGPWILIMPSTMHVPPL